MLLHKHGVLFSLLLSQTLIFDQGVLPLGQHFEKIQENLRRPSGN